MAAHEDDWNMDIGLGQFGLEIEAAQARQSDVEHQAARGHGKLALQHIRRRAEQLNLQSDRLKKVTDRSADRLVVR